MQRFFFLERDCSGIVKQLLPAISYCAEKEMYAIAIVCLNRQWFVTGGGDKDKILKLLLLLFPWIDHYRLQFRRWPVWMCSPSRFQGWRTGSVNSYLRNCSLLKFCGHLVTGYKTLIAEWCGLSCATFEFCYAELTLCENTIKLSNCTFFRKKYFLSVGTSQL